VYRALVLLNLVFADLSSLRRRLALVCVLRISLRIACQQYTVKFRARLPIDWRLRSSFGAALNTAVTSKKAARRCSCSDGLPCFQTRQARSFELVELRRGETNVVVSGVPVADRR
jgi:hypothetical protein